MRNLLLTFLLLFTPVLAFAQVTTHAGGTGLIDISTGSIPFGSVFNIRMGTSSALQFNNSLSRLTVTNASTTNVSVSSLTNGNCVQAGVGGLLTDTGSACGSGGGSSTFGTTSLSALFPIIYTQSASLAQFSFGGLTTSSAAVIGNLPYFTGVNTFGNVATTSVTCAGSASCSAFTVIGTSPITVTGSVGAFDPFTHTTYNGQTVSATSTGIWFTGSPFSLIASSTFATFATTTNATTTSFAVTNLISGNCVQAGTGGNLINSPNGACGSATGLSSYNAFTNPTLTSFATTSGMVINNASSTFVGNVIITGNSTTTNATTTTLFSSVFGLGAGNYFTSLLGTGLVNTGGTLTVSLTNGTGVTCSGNSCSLASIAAGVLGSPVTGIPTSQATSTLYGAASTGGFVLQWSNATNGLILAATSSSGGSGLTSYDAFTHPAAGQSATTSLLITTGGLISNASSTIGNNTQVGGLTIAGGATTTGFLAVQGSGTSTFAGGINLTGTDCFATQGTCLQTFIQNATAYKQAASYATAAVLAGTPTYNNGSSGVGATLTEVGAGALSIDGQAPSAGQRVLIKNQADQTTNGIYTVTATGSGIASYILTRATDYNTSNDVYAGTTVPILVGGTVNGDTQWTESNTGTIVIGTSNITFIETSFGTSGTVTSVALTVPTFLSVSGSPITTNGTLAVTLSGTALPIANGGTATTSFTTTNSVVGYNGTSLVTAPLTSALTFPYASTTVITATTASTTNLVISSAGGAVSCLQVSANGTVSATGSACGGSGSTPGGSNTEIQFNSSNTFGGATNLVWDPTNLRLGVGTTTPFSQFAVHAFANRPAYNPVIFSIASSSPTATTTALTLFANGSLLMPEYIVSPTSTSQTIDWTKGNQQLFRYSTSAVTITFSNVVAGAKLTLVTCDQTTGTAGAITFAGGHYSGGVQPGNTTTLNQCDMWFWVGSASTSTNQAILTGMSPGIQ